MHPLGYSLALATATLCCCAGWAVAADGIQLAGLTVTALGVAAYTAFRMVFALCGTTPVGEFRQLRQTQGLLSRRWIELHHKGVTKWVPVYSDPALAALPSPVSWPEGLRVYPSGRARTREPAGRLIDNPAVAVPERAATAGRWTRRLLLDAQPAVAAPFIALLWIYMAGGGAGTFAAATAVAACAIVWLWAIRGSDPG